MNEQDEVIRKKNEDPIMKGLYMGASKYWDGEHRESIAIVAKALEELKQVEGAPAIKIHKWGDLATMDIEIPPDIVEGFIPGASLTMFAGDGGIGKSYILLEMASRIAQGSDWLGMKTTKMPVLIIDLENRLWRTGSRVQRIIRGWELNEDVDVHFIFGSDFSLERDVDKLYERVEEFKYGFIILDSLVDFLEGMNENDNVEMATVCKQLRGITERTGAGLLPIHHVSKASAGTSRQSNRGASALKGNCDASIQVVRSGGGMGDILTMKHDKTRDFPFKYVKALLNWGDGTFNTTLIGSGFAKDSSSGNTAEQIVLNCLTDDWRKRSDVIAEAGKASGLGRSSLSAKLTGLVKDEMVDEDPDLFGRSTGVRLAQDRQTLDETG